MKDFMKLVQDRLIGDGWLNNAHRPHSGFQYRQSKTTKGIDQRPLTDEIFCRATSLGLRPIIHDCLAKTNAGENKGVYFNRGASRMVYVPASSLFNPIRSSWYTHMDSTHWTKHVPDDFEYWADVQTMARWIEDDGSMWLDGSMMLSTESFTKPENERLSLWVNRTLGVKSKVLKHYGKKYRILITSKDYAQIIPTIRRFFHECTSRKVLTSPPLDAILFTGAIA